MYDSTFRLDELVPRREIQHYAEILEDEKGCVEMSLISYVIDILCISKGSDHTNRTQILPFAIPQVMGAIISLGRNWWGNMNEFDA